MALMTALILQLFQMALVLAVAPLLAGLVRVLKARLQRRAGPPLLQMYRDLAKLITKDAVVATDASWLFTLTPYLIFATTWVSASLVPSFATNLLFSWAGDLIVIVALLGTARFFQMLAALDIGTAFGGLGASREAMFASLAEPAMLMIVFTVSLVAGSSQLSVIATYMHSGAAGLRLSLALGLVAMIIVALAETGRFPVDNPATHLELTMVHEAMVLEYSGRHLALIELAQALKLTLYMSLIACVFVSIGMAGPRAALPALALGLVTYLGKLVIGAGLLAVFESAIAKMRVFRVPNFIGAALMLGLLGTLLLFVSASL
jgi:formate hydrogenlyase subunit 4